MDVSLSETAEFICPQCGKSFTAEVWFIVDGSTRPDLVARAREGTLHNLPCPNCGNDGQVDVPLLLYLPDRTPPLLFSPAQQTTPEQDQQQVGGLLGALRDRLGVAWRDDWLAEGLQGVRPEMLPIALSNDPHEEDPEAYRELEQQAERAMQEMPPLVNAVYTFIQAETWAASQQIVKAHPELLTDEADALLAQIHEGARAQGDDNVARIVEEHRTLLQRCREIGVDAAFVEKTREAPGGRGAIIPAELRPILDDLSRPMGILDMPRRVELCRQALRLVSRAENPQLWAALQGELGNSLAQNPQGSRAENLERAIAGHEQALEVMTRETMPAEWAGTMMNLANAYSDRICGERAENLEQAITGYEQALEVRTRATMPVEWATTMINLADAYSDRIRGERGKNLERAIVGYKQALEVITKETMPVPWAKAMMGLANTYFERIYGERAENLEQAIVGYEQVLEVMTQEKMPVEWVQTMYNLAISYQKRIFGDRAENIERAITGYEQALEVMTQEKMPVEWAQTVNNLATAYLDRIRGNRAENLEQAIAGYKQALKVRTRAAMPVEWAQTVNNLAIAYSNRIRGEQGNNLEQAIAEYEQALEVRTRVAMPEEWAETMMGLATAYSNRIRGDRAENLEQAIAGYEKALEVMTQETMPVLWAQTMYNLAISYQKRILGDRAENLERAIVGYENALKLITQTEMPVEWTTTITNLATAYSNRIHGKRAENLEQAIAGYEKALNVLTWATMPVEWATTMMNLANTYQNRILGDQAENLEQAIAGYEQTLEVMTRAAMPEEWAQTVNNLATAYSHRIRGERAENLERAIAEYEKALEVRTQATMPVEWAETMMDLAIAYSNRIRGDRAENLERAIAGHKQALEVRTRAAMPVEWAMTMLNLATSYAKRIRKERAENLELAIAGFEQALEVMTREATPGEWAKTMIGLAAAYSVRIRGERAENLERAITCCKQALEAMTQATMPVEWAGTMMNLANAYQNRILGDRAENLEQAIAGYEQALEVRMRATMPMEWAETMINLANAYANRIRGERAENLERAIAGYQQALEVRTRVAMPVEWAQTMLNLANAYQNRILGDRAENLEQAIVGYEQALEVMTQEKMPVEWATTMMNLANAYYDRIRGERAENLERAIAGYEQALEIFRLETLPDEHRRVQRGLTHLFFAQQNWDGAVIAARAALEAGKLRYQTSTTPEARQAEVGATQDIPPLLSYALTRSETVSQEVLRTAVLVIEQNRARWLSEALSLQVQKPVSAPDEAWQAFLERRTRVEQFETELRLPDDTPGRRDYVTLRGLLGEARYQLQKSIDQVRAYAEDFMPASDWKEMQIAVTPEQPLVYIVATSMGGLALIVSTTSDEGTLVIPVWLDDLKDDILNERVQTYVQIYSAWGRAYSAYHRYCEVGHVPSIVGQAVKTTTIAWFEILEEMLDWLRNVLMQPIEDELARQGLSQAALVSTGYLGLLPLHAAYQSLSQSENQQKSIIFTYVPNARALTAARQRMMQSAPTRLLVVDNPDSSLTYADEAVSVALNTFAPDHCLRIPVANATFEAVYDALPEFDVWYFFTHGRAGWNTPLNGRLSLAHKTALTLADLLRLQVHTRLAVLAACEVGVLGMNVPDEVVSLPTGLLQAGVAGVVGTLWSVNESSTALLMMRFFEAWRVDGLEPPEALAIAQSWLRERTNAEFAAYIKQHPPYRDEVYWGFHLAPDQDKRPFEHPFYWAGFYYTGV